MDISGIKMYQFNPHGDDRGQLIALEGMISVPFDIKRVYYMYDTAFGARRGRHAHKNLQQILICVSGSCKVLLDDGTKKIIVNLNRPDEGLYIANNVWREMYDFSSGTVLMVLASDIYDESDYIRDYNEFLAFVKRGNE